MRDRPWRAAADARACPPARQPDQRRQRLRRPALPQPQKAGETDERLAAAADWRHTPHFTEAERAALALTEAVTRLADRPDPVPDQIWDQSARHYDQQALAALIISIAQINAWNRLNVAVGQVTGEWTA